MLDEDLNVIRPGRSQSRLPAAHVWRCARWFTALAFIPFVIGLIFAWTFLLGMFALLIGAPLVLASTAASGLIFTVRGIGVARRASSPWRAAGVGVTAPIMTAAAFLLAGPSLVAGGLAGDLTKLIINHHRYETIIAEAQQGVSAQNALWLQTHGRIGYVVDDGPPVRVAFEPEGLLDNWSGIIFDPTGDVMLANGFDENGDFQAPEQVTKLFGGDLMDCRHLWGDYYSCSFT